MKIASVESCTAGLISKIITDAPGSSEVFDLGITTYSNEMKTKMVGVPEDTLRAHGAVSPETARAMAEGILRVSGADIGVATTGIAGPGGGTPDKPVGLVYTAVSTRSGTVVTRLLLNQPGTDRDWVFFDKLVIYQYNNLLCYFFLIPLYTHLSFFSIQ